MTRMLACAATLALLAAGAEAATLRFAGDLSGLQEVPPAETTASGSATLTVDTDTETLGFALDVEQITLDDLEDDLVAGPMGPVHLHDAPAGVNGPIVVPFPLPFASAVGGYTETDEGFSLTVEDFAYADAVAISGSDVGFEAFVADLLADGYYVNVHTDAFPAGEIRGQLSPVPLPAGALLGLTGLVALAGLGARRRRA